MKRVGLFLLIAAFIFLPCTQVKALDNTDYRVVFVYHIPEDKEVSDEDVNEQFAQDIISDDVTADTSGISSEAYDNDNDISSSQNYLIDDLYTDVLQGYASYDEFDNDDGIELVTDEVLSLNIKKPVKINSRNFGNLKTHDSLYGNIYTKYNGSEYAIAPVSRKHSSKKYGGFSAGTLYEQEISSGELEQTSGIFSRYEYKQFALTTSYSKTINSTNNNYNDKFAVTPELKFGQYLTMKQKLSADTVKKRKKAELILSVNPFGKRDADRLRLDLSAGETYDEITNTFWNRFEFNTVFKL